MRSYWSQWGGKYCENFAAAFCCCRVKREKAKVRPDPAGNEENEENEENKETDTEKSTQTKEHKCVRK